VEQPLGDHVRIGVARQVVDQHQELVAAEAADHVPAEIGPGGVRGAQGAAQAAGDLAQHLVAGLMAQRVVDQLEAVEIEEHDRELVAWLLAAARDRQLEAGAEADAAFAVCVGREETATAAASRHATAAVTKDLGNTVTSVPPDTKRPRSKFPQVAETHLCSTFCLEQL